MTRNGETFLVLLHKESRETKREHSLNPRLSQPENLSYPPQEYDVKKKERKFKRTGNHIPFAVSELSEVGDKKDIRKSEVTKV